MSFEGFVELLGAWVVLESKSRRFFGRAAPRVKRERCSHKVWRARLEAK